MEEADDGCDGLNLDAVWVYAKIYSTRHSICAFITNRSVLPSSRRTVACVLAAQTRVKMGANTTLVYLRSERDERLRLVRNALRIGAMTGLLRLGSVVRV